MKKSISIKITALVLALSFVVPSAYALYPAQANAAAGAGSAVACIVGWATAAGFAIPAFIKEIVGVPDGSGNSGQHMGDTASNNSQSFTSCVLKPLAKIMVVALIRNIGSSIVNWVNSGFDGSPAFLTDFGGTILDTADQAVGTFIEGSELGYLCNNFSFKIRLALAVNYSQSFRQRATCSLTQIGNNLATNGGAGWNNFLEVSTRPQNNEYGAYVIAENEIAQRAFRAVGIQEKEIAVGQGFLNRKVCEDQESPEELAARQHLSSFKTIKGDNAAVGVQVTSTKVDLSSFGKYDIYGNQTEAGKTNTDTKTVFTTSEKPVCKKWTVTTPGSVIAGKINSSFAQGDIQAAVAQEIDDVIAATMNQLAQQVITGARGLLGMNRKKTTSQSYLAKYQSQLYGENASQGATSPIEDYQVSSYDAAAKLIDNDPQIDKIYESTNAAAEQAISQQQEQQAAIQEAFGGQSSTDQNYALSKPATQSSIGAGPASNATNGIKDGAASQYNAPAGTGEEQYPWWQVDLGTTKDIREVRIWKVTNESESDTLGTIRVVASDGPNDNVWTSDYITPTSASANPIVVAVNKARRYVKIEKQGTLDNQCRVAYENGPETIYESCYHPLKLAEVEVIGTPSTAGIPGTSVSSSTSATSGSSNNTVADDGRTATSTVAWETAVSPNTVTTSAPLDYELHLTQDKPLTIGSGVTIRTSLKRNGSPVSYLSVFSSYEFSYGRQGDVSSKYSISSSNDSGGFALTNVTNPSANGYYLFKQGGAKKPGGLSGSYTITTTVEDSFGTVLKTATASFVVQ